jgi:hypothetical protein
MTAEEKISISDRLRIEIQNAESTLAYKREKAFQFTQRLREVIETVEMNCNLQPSREDFEMETSLERRLSPEYQGVLNYTAAITLISDLKTARHALFNVNLRKSQIAPHL